MIIYIATYPRCGNSWLRLMIGMNWRLLTSNGYQEDFAKLKATLENYDLGKVPVTDVVAGVPSVLRDWIVTYRPRGTAEVRLLLKPGCLAVLDDEARDFLAGLPHKILVKTHDYPPENPRAGEIAVQMVRHPGAAIASYHRMERDFGIEGGGFPSLAAMMKGQCNYGSWKDYHEAWLKSSMTKLQVKYEDAHEDELGVSLAIGEFLGLDGEPKQSGFFEGRNAAAPKRYPGGTIDGWVKHFDPDHMRLLRATHKHAAHALGYSIPFHPDESIVIPTVADTAPVSGSASCEDFSPADAVVPSLPDVENVLNATDPSTHSDVGPEEVILYVKPDLFPPRDRLAQRFLELDQRDVRIRQLLEERRQISGRLVRWASPDAVANATDQASND